MPSTMVQIRNVPPELHRRLKARAAIEGLSMSDFVLREVGKALDQPTRQEVLERLQARPLRRLRRSAAEVLRGRVWALRRNLTAYDAVYVALAEALEASLVTCDGRLARAPGMARRVELVR